MGSLQLTNGHCQQQEEHRRLNRTSGQKSCCSHVPHHLSHFSLASQHHQPLILLGHIHSNNNNNKSNNKNKNNKTTKATLSSSRGNNNQRDQFEIAIIVVERI